MPKVRRVIVTERAKNRNDEKQARYSEKQKLDAVNAYVVLGKVISVVQATGIPEDTVYKWRMTQWWKDAEEEIRRTNKIQLSGKLSKIIDNTILQLEDRIENGDYFFNPKTGEWNRKKINAAVASKITNELIDKTLILEKEVTAEKITDEGLELRLKKLKDEMIKFAASKTIEGTHELVDITS